MRCVTILATLLVLGGAGFFGLTWWEARQSPVDAVRVAIHAPEAIRSGEKVTVEIGYENPQNNALASLVLDVNVPQGFRIESTSPEPTNQSQLAWTIGTLGRYSDGKITLTGMWYGDVPQDDRIQVITTYRPENVHAEFSLLTTARIAVSESVVLVDLTGPEKATAGEQVTYTAAFTNQGADAQFVEGEFILPAGFVPQTWNPPLEPGGGTIWQINALEPGKTTTQIVTGAYASSVQDMQEVKVRAFFRDNQGKSYLQSEKAWLTQVQGGALQVSLAGNGSTEKVGLASGDRLRISVQLANVTQSPVTDAEILLDFQPEQGVPIVWSDAVIGKARITAKGVTLAAADVGTLAPGEQKYIRLFFL